MWAFLASLISALPTAAKSNAGLAAFAIAAVTYIGTVWRVSRNKQLLKNIQKLPARDRLAALEVEMGGVRLASGISPEQWVRSRIHRYYFLAFSTTVVLATVMFTLIFIYWNGSADITVDLKQSLSQPNLPDRINRLFVSQAHANDVFNNHSGDDRVVRYNYSKDNDKITISPALDYLEAQRRGDPVYGFSWWYDPFKWDFPSLSVKVSNNTRRDLVLSEVVFRVRNSIMDIRPVFAVVGPSYFGKVNIYNEGWGNIVNTFLNVSVKSPRDCNVFNLGDGHSIVLGPWDGNWRSGGIDSKGNMSFSISELVSDKLMDELKHCTADVEALCSTTGMCAYGRKDYDDIKCLDERPRDRCDKVNHMPPDDVIEQFRNEATRFRDNKNVDIYFKRRCSRTQICVQGQLDYTDQSGKNGTLRFATIAFLEEPPVGAPMPPSFSYDAFLKAGKSNYTQRLSIAQQIKPGEGDNFSIRVATDRTASFEFDMDILTTSGAVAWTGSLELTIFVPSSGARRAVQSQR